ncbi:MAG: siderophore-interacting protein [Actinomycetota bacterium]
MSANDDRPIRTRREPPPFRRARVASTEHLSAHMLRVVVAGDALDGFAIESPASSVRLLLPPDGGDELVMPVWTGNQFELPDGRRAPIRTFTPRYFDPDRSALTLDVVLHDHGAATEWARRTVVGDEVAISGPGRSEPLPADARSHLLVGDESAVPAIGQLLEAIPADHVVDVHAEVRGADARIDLPAHPNASVNWHHAVANAAPGDSMIAAVGAIADLPDAVWVAGEAAAVQRIRKHLFDGRGRARDTVTARGYWKLGRAAT